MRRVGTISSSVGLIFLGIWMILNRTNPSYADQMLKWWPLIIILMGVEVLVYFSRKSENERVGFSFLIIPVILIFIIVNITQGIENKISNNFGKGLSFNNMIDYFKDFDSERYKIIDTSKTLDGKISSLSFNTDNADINIRKSTDGKTKFALKVYVDRGESISSYNLKEIANGEDIIININENYIKKVSGDIYISDGCNVVINTNNLRLNSTEDIIRSSLKIKSDNSAITVNEANELSIDSDNISAEVSKIGTLNANSSSGMIKINGSIDNLKLVMDNGKIDVYNESGKNADIKLNDGMVNYRTKVKDADVDLELDSGICNLNGERRVNSGISQKIGNGENRISIKVDNGTLSFSNRE